MGSNEFLRYIWVILQLNAIEGYNIQLSGRRGQVRAREATPPANDQNLIDTAFTPPDLIIDLVGRHLKQKRRVAFEWCPQ